MRLTPTHKLLTAALAAALVFALGRCTAREAAPAPVSAPASAPPAAPEVWTCPMHPQIHLPEFGPCPICGMDLVLRGAGPEDAPRRLAMTAEAVALAGVRTTRVERRAVTRPVRLVGKVAFDETAVRTIAAWVPGRLERLFVDYEGVRVQVGDHLVELYSPELFNAQEELLSARERLADVETEATAFLAQGNRAAYQAARDKLLLYGLTDAQLEELETRGTASERMTINAPTAGVVIEKRLDEGAYVTTGTPIYRIADLDRLWLQLEAFEQDLAWLRYGQAVTIEVEALPGELFEGRVTFLGDVVDARTRTTEVRVHVPNEDGRLKPGMFVHAVVAARLGAGGVVSGPSLAGKWVSPMHPEVVKDEPGQCDVCGMDLVPAEELGLVEPAAGGPLPLVVPRGAVLVTGERAVVYVEVPGAQRPTFEGREVLLGPRAGEDQVVLAGLAEGERVVTAGAFRIDASMQIQAKPSMMSVPGQGPRLALTEASWFLPELEPLYAAYLELQEHLAEDELASARGAAERLLAALDPAGSADLSSGVRELWREERARLAEAARAAAAAQDLAGARKAFDDLSRAVRTLVRDLGQAGAAPLVEVHCPMAFGDRGASWLQRGEAVRNPYFGRAMYTCGTVEHAYAPARVEPREVAPAEGGEGAPGAGPADAPEHEHEPEPAVPDDAPLPGGARGGRRPLAALADGAVAVGVALAADDAPATRRALDALARALATARDDAALAAALADVGGAPPGDDLEALRAWYDTLSRALVPLVRARGNPLAATLRVVHCPMAFDGRGADWLQREARVANPYYGALMLRCGAVTDELEPAGGPR
ncbi:MAG: efflux RND transporter periplasmic adaptor subunit [Planctomycetes bacterium]|nr:efflux RND transporter periplasmic adaptor subunit [Planctomycetota bacterium]